ncbi:Wbp2nl [Symbiodinium sp. CCMP2592]|nr:Wbp2nl [Symbiodinium sp. CCMP2592]
MAVNPLLAQDGANQSLFPMPETGEAFVLKRDNIDFECSLPRGGKLWGRGSFFLSSKRIVFVALDKSCRQDFRSFAIPLQTLRKPKFEQPIFGANYLAGSTRPLPGTENDQTAAPLLGGDTVFYLTFRSGGCNTFLQLLFQLLSEVQAQNSQNTIAQAAQEGRLNQVAYVDPSDPSVLYLSQPTAVAGSEEQTNFQMDAPSAPPPEGHPQPARGGGNQQCVIC